MTGIVECLSRICAGSLDKNIRASWMLLQIFGEVVDYMLLVS